MSRCALHGCPVRDVHARHLLHARPDFFQEGWRRGHARCAVCHRVVADAQDGPPAHRVLSHARWRKELRTGLGAFAFVLFVIDSSVCWLALIKQKNSHVVLFQIWICQIHRHFLWRKRWYGVNHHVVFADNVQQTSVRIPITAPSPVGM